MKSLNNITMLAAAVALLAAPALASNTAPLVQPTARPGNFVAVDDLNICETLLGEHATEEMIGFKVDPPADLSDAFVSFDLSDDGKSLSWTIAGGRMLAVVVKGGPNYNLYNYFAANLDPSHDTGLASPLQKGKIPQISHYNVCYIPDPRGGEGCTPGYWRNHGDRWVGVAPTDDFDTTFGVDLFVPPVDPDRSLGWAIWAKGGGIYALARHATAALLNAHATDLGSGGQFVSYKYTVAQVIQMVQDAEANGTIEDTKNALAAENERGCPLSETKAKPVVP